MRKCTPSRGLSLCARRVADMSRKALERILARTMGRLEGRSYITDC